MELKDMPNVVLVLVISGVLLGAGILAMSSFRGTGATLAAGNESGIDMPTTAGTVNLGQTDLTAFAALYNTTTQSASTLIGSGNYTVDLPTGVLTAATVNYENDSVSAVYTYRTKDVFYTTLSNSTKAGGNLAAQLPTVGTILGVAIILVVVLSAFNYGRGKL